MDMRTRKPDENLISCRKEIFKMDVALGILAGVGVFVVVILPLFYLGKWIIKKVH